jgi:glycosyltransferase involved in cell wall biosynthesis
MEAQANLVSVVVPCFNGARYLREAIESALAQTYSPIEVIVVDDGSTDESAAIAQSFGDAVRLVRQPNSGLSAARNMAIKVSRGAYVCLLDADDVLLPDCIERRMGLIDPSIGIVTGNYRNIGPSGEALPTPDERRVMPEGELFYAVARRNWGPPAGWLIRRDAIQKVGGFDPLLLSCEDWDFLLRLSLHFGMAYDAAPGVLYRITPGSMTRNHLRMYDECVRMFRKNKAYAPSRSHYWLASQRGRFEHSVGAVLVNILKGHTGAARVKIYLSSILKRPMLALYTVAWAGRFSFNRILGRKPRMQEHA